MVRGSRAPRRGVGRVPELHSGSRHSCVAVGKNAPRRFDSTLPANDCSISGSTSWPRSERSEPSGVSACTISTTPRMGCPPGVSTSRASPTRARGSPRSGERLDELTADLRRDGGSLVHAVHEQPGLGRLHDGEVVGQRVPPRLQRAAAARVDFLRRCCREAASAVPSRSTAAPCTMKPLVAREHPRDGRYPQLSSSSASPRSGRCATDIESAMSITIDRPAITHPDAVCQKRTPNSSECAWRRGGGVATASTDNMATGGAVLVANPAVNERRALRRARRRSHAG